MKTRWIIVILAACITVSLYLRIALPFDNVFTGQWIKFSSIDAYWQMANVDKMAPDFPAYISQIFNVPFFQWLLSGVIWCIGFGIPSQALIDTVAVYFPPILADLTVIPVYFIGKVLFNRYVGIVAAALIAVLPGEWLGRSILGFTDHHVAEVLFSTTALMFFLLAIKSEGKRQIVYAALAALFLFICVYSWTSGVLIVVIIVVYMIARISQIALLQLNHPKHGYEMLYFVAAIGVLLMGFAVFMSANPGLTSKMFAYLTTSTTITTTAEMRPLFFPSGFFTPMVAWGNFTTMFFIAPVAMVILFIRSRRDSNALFLIIWCAVMLVAMLCFRRFAYYFAINAALLGGFMAWYLWQHIKDRAVAIMITTVLLCVILIPSLQVATIQTKHSTFSPSDAWMKALEWTKNNTEEDSLILAWWDYGYWINREADRTAYVNPSQDKVPVTNTARMFLSPSDNNTVNADYIIIDYDTVMGKFWAISTWAGEELADFSAIYYIVKDGNHQPVHLFYQEYYQSLAVRLYNFDGKAVTPTQSTVIGINLDGKVLNTIDVYGTYEEAVENCGVGERLVGTSAFISPVPLEKVDGYSLVWESVETVEGIAEVKIFKVGVK